MTYTVPSDGHVTGDIGHIGDHNNIIDVLKGMGAVYNILNSAYSGGADPSGTNDSTLAIQAALTAARTSGGAVVYVPPGTYLASQSLQIGSNTVLAGAGAGISTIRCKAASLSGFTQVGSNTGCPLLVSYQNNAVSRVAVTGLTLDGNQANAGTLPGYADGPECSPVGIWNSSLVSITGVEVINAVGYSIYLQLCTDSAVTGCRVLSGSGSALGTNQQDGIHLTGCAHCRVENNSVDTGTGTAGDDGIALQALGTACTDIVITGNVVRAAQSGIHLAIGSTANIQDVAVTGNVIWQVTGADGLRVDTSGSGAVVAVTVTGNSFRNMPNHAIQVTAPFTGLTVAGNHADDLTGGLAYAVYVASTGSDLTISGNTLSNCGTANGIVIGPAAGGSSVTKWDVTGNMIDMSAGTAAALGMLVTDCPDGVISGNTILGSTQSSSAGIKVNGVSVAPAGISVTGNRVKGWATGILETNGGVTPDYIVYTGNNCHGCTAFITTTGTHDVTGNNVVA